MQPCTSDLTWWSWAQQHFVWFVLLCVCEVCCLFVVPLTHPKSIDVRLIRSEIYRWLVVHTLCTWIMQYDAHSALAWLVRWTGNPKSSQKIIVYILKAHKGFAYAQFIVSTTVNKIANSFFLCPCTLEIISSMRSCVFEWTLCSGCWGASRTILLGLLRISRIIGTHVLFRCGCCRASSPGNVNYILFALIHIYWMPQAQHAAAVTYLFPLRSVWIWIYLCVEVKDEHT